VSATKEEWEVLQGWLRRQARVLVIFENTEQFVPLPMTGDMPLREVCITSNS
jgi:hypothetical protein